MKHPWASVFSILFASASAFGATSSIQDEIKSLEIPTEMKTGRSEVKEALFATHERYSPLGGRLEVFLGGAKDFTPDSFLSTNQFQGGLRFFLSNKFFVGLQGALLGNTLADSALRLYDSTGTVPDVAWVRKRADLMLGYHLFYGKLRPAIDQNLYFDYFISAGAGLNDTNAGSGKELVLDTGFAFWLGRWGSFRLGARDYIARETRTLTSATRHHVNGYAEFGILLGSTGSDKGAL